MGANYAKANHNQTQAIDLRSEKRRRQYYLNIPRSKEGHNYLGEANFDITEMKKVGYGHLQKTNMFHKLKREGKSEFSRSYDVCASYRT